VDVVFFKKHDCWSELKENELHSLVAEQASMQSWGVTDVKDPICNSRKSRTIIAAKI
jgi:hypothetical protein